MTWVYRDVFLRDDEVALKLARDVDNVVADVADDCWPVRTNLPPEHPFDLPPLEKRP